MFIGAIIIHGMLSINHQPVESQRVLIISEKTDSIIAVTLTDKSGHYSCPLPELEKNTKLYVLAKFRTPEIAAVQYQPVTTGKTESIDFDLNPKSLVDLHFTLKSSAGLPEHFLFTMDAVSVTDIPSALAAYFSMETATSSNNYFYRVYDSTAFTVKVNPGSYRVHGSYIVTEYPDANPAGFKSYITTHATLLPGKPLAGSELGGFTVDVSKSSEIELELRALREDEAR